MNNMLLDRRFIINLLTEILKESKPLKSERITIINDSIYGSNLDYTIIKYKKTNIDINIKISFISKDMALFIRNIEKMNDPIIITDYNIICGDFSIEINNIYQENHIIEIYSKFTSFTFYNNPIITIDDAKEYMDKVLQCKAAEKDLIKINRDHIMIMHGSMLPINKSDKVSLKIYDYTISDKYNYNNSSIYEYTIFKKSLNPITVFMLCLNIY